MNQSLDSNRIGRCKENHKNKVYQCNLVTDQIQTEFNRQYWSSNKEKQDDYILKSVKVVQKLNSTELDYKYFIFGYQVCSKMFIKTLGFKTRSRIEYFFRKLKRDNLLNSLKAPIDGRKNNRVKSRSHSEIFSNDLISFVRSFKPVKKSRKFIIEDYKPIDLFKIMCEKLNYELIYENKNLKTKKKEQTSSSISNLEQASANQIANLTVNEYYDESVNGSILMINEMSSSQLTQHQSNQSVQDVNNFYLFNQSINRINNQISLSIKQNNNSSVQNPKLNVDQIKNQNRDDFFQTNEICSYSYFLRFLKKHNFEFK